MDRFRTAPSVNASGQSLGKAAHFDTAFIVEDLALYKSEGGISDKSFFSTNITLNLIFFFFYRSACRSSTINIQSSAPVWIFFSPASLH
jgi:hypothetical protein